VFCYTNHFTLTICTCGGADVSGRSFDAEEEGEDPFHDIFVARLSNINFPVVAFGSYVFVALNQTSVHR
jgi:hypothetical protein